MDDEDESYIHDENDPYMQCPACGNYTKGIREAYRNGDNCPYCELPHHAAGDVRAARERGANAQLTEKYTQLLIEHEAAREKLVKAEAWIARIQRAVKGAEW